jgi:hypothetical protein
MRSLALASTTALGIVVGAVFFNAAPAYADWPVIDITSIAKEVQQIGILNDIVQGLQTVQSSLNSLLGANGPIASVLGNNSYGTVQQLLQEGFTQNANYSKAQVGAQEQIADASNEAMAQFDLQMRDAQIRDQQTTSPTQCAALDGGVSIQAASEQSYNVGYEIARTQDWRDESLPNMPSYYGAAQGDAASSREHLASYCDPNDVAAGLCASYSEATMDTDQSFSSLFGTGTYITQAALNTANAYATNLIEPVAPAALRGDQLNSLTGLDAAVKRRSYNARISAAQTYVDSIVGLQSQSVPLTTEQQQYLTDAGLPVPSKVSLLQSLQIESERRVSDLNWNAELQAMPPASVEREIATELALNNYLLFQVFKFGLERGVIDAANLAVNTEHDYLPTAPLPTPSVASSSSP